MKRIIGKRIYNTETAVYIGGWIDHNGNNGANMYKKSNGEYFSVIRGRHTDKEGMYQGLQLFRMAGPECSVENCGGCPLFEACIREKPADWAENNITADEYIAEFKPEE